MLLKGLALEVAKEIHGDRFGFGGDAFLPTQTVGFAAQTRQWLTRTLNAEVAEGYLSEAEAIQIAQQLLHDNQHRLFGQS